MLEGSVRKAGNSVRITAQLIKAGTDTHLWSQTYDRKLDDIFAIQDEIAADVVKQLKVTLLGAAPKARTTDPEAYALYLQAVQLGRQSTAEAFKQSDALYRKVLAIDPRYAPAWAALAENFYHEASQGLLSNKEGYAQAREAATKALAIDPEYAPAHARLGYHRDVRRQRPRRRRAALQARAGARSGGSGRAAQQRRAAPVSWPPGRGAGARRGRRAPRSGERVGALQPGPSTSAWPAGSTRRSRRSAPC